MKYKLLSFLQIPVSIRSDFLTESVRKNDLALRVISMMILGMELYNVCRVLFLTKSGLGTLNNRIYFGMYCSLLLIACLFLATRRHVKAMSLAAQCVYQYGTVALIFLWHICLNSYDLYRESSSGVMVFNTAILGLAVFIQMPRHFSVGCFVLGYGLFQILAGPFLSSGEEINLTITSIVALGMSLINSHHAAINLQQRQEIAAANEKLQKLVQLDPLTGLLNKTWLENTARQWLQDNNKQVRLTLFMIDLDDFKEINDRHGHPCGDYVLIQTASRLRDVFPASAVLGRIGGDEFAVLLECQVDEQAAVEYGNRMIRELENLKWNGQIIGVCCSVGICQCDCSDATYEELYEEMDRMLYSAKRNGKGCCCFQDMSFQSTRQCAACGQETVKTNH